MIGCLFFFWFMLLFLLFLFMKFKFISVQKLIWLLKYELILIFRRK